MAMTPLVFERLGIRGNVNLLCTPADLQWCGCCVGIENSSFA